MATGRGSDGAADPCGECGAPPVAGARFCGRCGAVVAPAAAGSASGAAGTPGTDPTASADTEGLRGAPPADRGRWRARAGAAAAAAVLAFVVWPSSPGPGTPSGRDVGAPLPAELVLRWDVPVPGIAVPTGAGRPPVRLGDGAVAVADVVVDARGAPTAARPPGALAAGTWAAAGGEGLVVGEAVTGRITTTRPWPPGLGVTPVGPVLAWVARDDADGPGDPVLAVAGGGAVRLDVDDLAVQWHTEAVPVVDDGEVGVGDGPLVPARTAGSIAPDAVLDLRDGRVVARTSGDLRLLGIGHGLVLTADGSSLAAWPVHDGAATAELPDGRRPRWELSLAPGRPVGVDVLDGERFAVLAVDIVIGEARLVDARDGSVLSVVAAFPNTDLDGGRTAEAFDDLVVGVVDDELRRFTWEGSRLPGVPLGREDWFVTRGDGLLQLVAWRTGDVRLVSAGGTEVPVRVPPPRSDGPAVLAVVGDAVVVVTGPGGVRWVDARTGALDVEPPTGRAAEAGDPTSDADRSTVAVDVAGAGEDAVVVVEPGTVALLDRGEGAERWRTALPARPALASRTPHAHPGVVVTDRHVVLPLADGSVVALGLASGDRVWRTQVGVPSAVVGAGEEVLVATVDGRVVRLGSDGRMAQLAALDGAVVELAVAGEHVVALLPERLVGVGPPGGPLPDEDRVELSLVRPAQPDAS